MRDPIFDAFEAPRPTLRERLRLGGSLAAAVTAHLVLLILIVVLTRPAPSPLPPEAIEVEIVPPPDAPPPQTRAPPQPAEPPEAWPIPPAAEPPPQSPFPEHASPAPPDRPAPSSRESPPLPFPDGGFAVTTGPLPTVSTTAPPPPPTTKGAARMAPLVITARGPHDPRMPAYPAEARDKGEQGDVTVEVELDASGSIKATRITRSSGSISLDATALRSARTLRFRPPRPPDGTVLRHAVVVEIPFRFQLQ